LQTLLLLCLLLPVVQPWRPDVIVMKPLSPLPVGGKIVPPEPQPEEPFSYQRIALGLILAGAAVRLFMLASGCLRLRGYRRRAAVLHPQPQIAAQWQRDLDARALFCLSDEIGGPVTFGWLHPVILLPGRFFLMSEHTQEAIICHELLHVKRRDWLVTLVEECAGSILWFHPAVWWLLSRIRLRREQTVDEAVIQLTKQRDRYVEALLEVADPGVDLAPAPLFLRERHVVLRIGSLVQEVVMSKRRVAFSLLSSLLAVLAAGSMAVRFLPLQAAPQVEVHPGDSGVTAQPGGGLKLLHRPALRYPPEAAAKRVEGVVTLEVTVAADGTVSDARVLNGPVELRRAALQSVLTWHYSREGAPTVTTASLEYKAPAEGSRLPLDRIISAVPRQDNPAAAAMEIKRFEYSGLPSSLVDALRPKLSAFEGRRITPDVLAEIRNVLTEEDSHLSFGPGKDGVMFLRLPDTRPAAPVRPAGAAVPPTQIRVGGNVQSTKLISQPMPVYPPLAKQARIQGTVRFEAVIGADGRIVSLNLVSGHPLLVEAAQEAVRQWVYQPTLLNGVPTQVITQIDVNFTLSGEPSPEQP
jgi:TonB family protein